MILDVQTSSKGPSTARFLDFGGMINRKIVKIIRWNKRRKWRKTKNEDDEKGEGSDQKEKRWK